MIKIINVAHFCSGGGTTVANVAAKANNAELGDVRSKLIIVSKSNAGAVEKAEKLGIKCISWGRPRDSKQMLKILEENDIAVASFNGWIPLVPAELIEGFTAKGGIILNQHPGIIRADGRDFGGGGKEYGMYGARVTAARILFLIAQNETNPENIFTETTFQELAVKIDHGAPYGVMKLFFAEELSDFKKDSGLDSTEKLNEFFETGNEETEKKLRKFVSDIQSKLLSIEHKNVASTLAVIGSGEKLKEAKTYRQGLISLEDEEMLYEAKARAVKMYPKG